MNQLDDRVWDALKRERWRNQGAEKVVLSLRRKLREFDPSLPSEYDGNAWMEIEAVEHKWEAQ